MSKISEDELRSMLNDLIDVKDYLEGCLTCGLPCLIHKGTTYTSSSQAEAQEKYKILKEFRDRIKPIFVWMKRERDKEKKMSLWKKSLETLVEKVNTARDLELQQLVEIMEKKFLNEEIRNMAE